MRQKRTKTNLFAKEEKEIYVFCVNKIKLLNIRERVHCVYAHTIRHNGHFPHPIWRANKHNHYIEWHHSGAATSSPATTTIMTTTSLSWDCSCLNGMHLELKSLMNTRCKCANNVRDRKAVTKQHEKWYTCSARYMRRGDCRYAMASVAAVISSALSWEHRAMVLVHGPSMEIEIVNKQFSLQIQITKFNNTPIRRQSVIVIVGERNAV